MEERIRCAPDSMWLHLTTLLLLLLVQGGASAGTRLHDSKLSQITQLQVAEGLPGAESGGHEWTGSQRHADEARRQTTVSSGQKSIEPSPSTDKRGESMGLDRK